MCYAIPAKLIKIQGSIGVIDYFGEHRKILLDDPTVKVGDYVYAQGGVLVSKVPESEALKILETWKEIFFELKKTDEALAKVDTDHLPPNALAVLQQVNLRKTLTPKDALALWQLNDPNELSVLYEIANNVRQREHGNSSCIHGIIEFSNYCHQDCWYCGIRCGHAMPRYRMSVDEVIATAKDAVDRYGFKALVLQSGEDLWYDEEKLTQIVKTIRAMGVLVFLSLGSREQSLYQKLFDAGARAALLRFETSNPEIFEALRPGTKLADRIALIRALKKMGYVIATGFMLGLPDETAEDVINNIFLTKSLQPDMFSFGPFIPTEETPLAKAQKIAKEPIFKAIAISRFIEPDSNILVTTALETIDKNAKKEGLMAGANSLMINITPAKYKPLYAIYQGKVTTKLESEIKNTVDLLFSLGRAPTDLGVNKSV
jgi:biotin synthase